MSPHSALELRTSPSPTPAPTPGPGPTAATKASGSGTILPSFDDLLRSIDQHEHERVAPHHVHSRYSPQISHTPEHHHMIHGHSREHGHSPYSAHHHRHHLDHSRSQTNGPDIRRTPSTPPTPSSLSSTSNQHHNLPSLAQSEVNNIRTRPRSSTAPSISRTRQQSPFRVPHSLPHQDDYLHTHADRISALKEGDGEWNPWSFDAVVPAALPYYTSPGIRTKDTTTATSASSSSSSSTFSSVFTQLDHRSQWLGLELELNSSSTLALKQHARPHLHPRVSTGSIPYHLHQSQQCSPLHPSRPTHNRQTSLGSISHSPLSTNDPLTPRSIHASCEADWNAFTTPTPSSAGSTNSFCSSNAKSVPIAQPQGVRIPLLPTLN